MNSIGFWKKGQHQILWCQSQYQIPQTFSGSALGLSLVLNVEQYEYVPAVTSNVGIKVNHDVQNKIKSRTKDNSLKIMHMNGHAKRMCFYVIMYVELMALNCVL